MIERRRLLLMRHGAVEYFDASGRPYPPDDVPLTAAGIEQARAMGTAFAAAGLAVDRTITSGLVRTRQTAEQVLDAAGLSPPMEHWAELREIQPGHLPSIAEAEQYLLWLSLIALSTSEGFRLRPRTTKCMWILVNTFGSVSARSAFTSTLHAVTFWPLRFRISTTSKAVHAPVPASTVSIGRGPRLRPPASGAPSITKACPLPVSATKLIPPSIHFTVHSMAGSGNLEPRFYAREWLTCRVDADSADE